MSENLWKHGLDVLRVSKRVVFVRMGDETLRHVDIFILVSLSDWITNAAPASMVASCDGQTGGLAVQIRVIRQPKCCLAVLLSSIPPAPLL